MDKPILTALYEVAYLTAKQGKPHVIGETLVKPAAMQLAKIMLGKEAENKLSLVPLSNKVVESRINDICENILSQVVADLKATQQSSAYNLMKSPMLLIYTSLSHLYVKIKGQKLKKSFFFANNL